MSVPLVLNDSLRLWHPTAFDYLLTLLKPYCQLLVLLLFYPHCSHSYSFCINYPSFHTCFWVSIPPSHNLTHTHTPYAILLTSQTHSTLSILTPSSSTSPLHSLLTLVGCVRTCEVPLWVWHVHYDQVIKSSFLKTQSILFNFVFGLSYFSILCSHSLCSFHLMFSYLPQLSQALLHSLIYLINNHHSACLHLGLWPNGCLADDADFALTKNIHVG